MSVAGALSAAPAGQAARRRPLAVAEPAVEIRDVTKVYGAGDLAFAALRGVDLVVPRGEFLLVVGPSGSGKSTFLQILGCLLAPTSGSVRLFGTRVSGRPESELPRFRLAWVGFVFQGGNLVSALSAEENVTLLLQLRGYPTRAARREARTLLDRVGLGGKAGRRPAELSGGERQRVAIARALAGGPPLLLADEPTASLDARSGREIGELLKSLATEEGRTVVFVTHDPRVFDLADRVVRIEDGRLFEDMTPSGAEVRP